MQDFGINNKKVVGLPYDKKSMNEVVVFNAVKNTNIMYLYFTFPGPLQE